MAAKRTGRLAKSSAAVPTRDLAESLESAVFGAVKDTLAPVLQSLQPGPSKNSTHRRKGDSRKRRIFIVHLHVITSILRIFGTYAWGILIIPPFF